MVDFGVYEVEENGFLIEFYCVSGGLYGGICVD